MIDTLDSLPLPGWQPPPFIGRQAYLDRIRQVLYEVHDGDPAILFLQGEAGVGKTRLLSETHALAAQHNFALCGAQCREDMMLPYAPFAAALRALATPSTALADLPEADRQFVSQWLQGQFIVPDLEAPGISAQIEHQRMQLFLRLSQVIMAYAQQQPTLLLIDDLHWADAPSLDLLMYLASTLAERAQQGAVPIGIIATHRPVPSSERLWRFLLRCRREPICQSLDMQGLDDLELADLLGALGVEQPSPNLRHTLMETTSGSPLFVVEMLYYMQERQLLQSQQGETVTAVEAADLRLPTTVTDTFMSHIATLSPGSRDLLTEAALLGQVFDLQLLSALSELSEDEMLTYLDEAVQRHLLISEGQTFRFVHALLRHALVHLPSVPRRQRRHWHIAQVLLDLYGPELDAQQSLEVARHLLDAGPVAQAETVVQHVRRAGDTAFSQCDWTYAAQAYAAVLTATESGDLLTVEERAKLCYLAGVACARDGDGLRSDAYHDQAIAAYRGVDNLRGVARSLTTKMLRLANANVGTPIEIEPLTELLEDIQESDLGLRGHIATALSEIYWARREPSLAESMAQYAIDMGQSLEDWPLCARASFNLSLAHAQQLRLSVAITDYEQSRHYAQRAGDTYFESWPLPRMVAYLLMLGHLEAVQTVAAEAHELAANATNWRDHSLTVSTLSALALYTGAFDATERHAREAIGLAARYRLPFGGAFAALSLACAHALRGAWNDADTALTILLEPGRVFEQPNPMFTTMVQLYRQLIHTYMPAPTSTAEVTPSWREIPVPTTCDISSLSLCCALVELSAAHADATHAKQFLRVLTPLLDEGIVFAREWSFLLPRIVGLAATLDRQWDTAEHYFQTAIAQATELGAHPECARTYLDYAQMLMTRGEGTDDAQALELVHKGHLRCQESGMEPFVQRSNQLIETLQTRLSYNPISSMNDKPQPIIYDIDILNHIIQNDTRLLQ